MKAIRIPTAKRAESISIKNMKRLEIEEDRRLKKHIQEHLPVELGKIDAMIRTKMGLGRFVVEYLIPSTLPFPVKKRLSTEIQNRLFRLGYEVEVDSYGSLSISWYEDKE